MVNGPIPLDPYWSLHSKAVDLANAMVAAHWKEFNDLFAAIKHPLVTDAGSKEENTASENDAFHAGDAFGYAGGTLSDIVTSMTTGWKDSGVDAWKGPAATTFTNLVHTLHTYVNDLWGVALKYAEASVDAALAHQKARLDFSNLLYNWLHTASSLPAAIENKLFYPARMYDARRKESGSVSGTTRSAFDHGYDEWLDRELEYWYGQFKNGYNWFDTFFVLSYVDISKAGFKYILPTLSSSYGESYLGLPVVPVADFPVVNKKLDPYAAEKEDIKKAKDALDKQKDDLDKAQGNAQDQLDAQQKQLADDAAKQQDALEKQQAAAQDQMDAQQKQLADDAAKQQDALGAMPGGPTDPGAPMDAGTPNMPGGGQPPNDLPALDPAGMPTGVPVPAGAPTAVVAGPNGALGLDTTGDGVMDVPLPVGAAVVPRAGGGSAVDVNGDGTADVDMAGNAVAGGSAPPGSRLVTGADGQVVGYDINGDGVADLDLDGNALPGGVLPAGSRFVTGLDGRQGFDMDGNGIPDTDPRGVPLPNSAYFNNPPAGPPDAAPPPALNPGNQVQLPPAAPVAGPPGALAPTIAGAAMGGAAEAAAQGGGYPPMYPPMGGGGMGQSQNDKSERERQTWLQEEEDVWEGDMVAVAATAQLGRPVEDEEPVEEWEEPVAPPSRTTPRQPRPGQYPTGTRR
jgi:hypothetical protein